MKPTVFVLVAGIGASALSAASAHAHPVVLGKPAAKGAAQKEPGAAEVSKKVKVPDGVKFGMTLEEVSKLYEAVLTQEYTALYKEVEPGPRMAELDAELADKKTLLLRNKFEFSSLPSGLDSTPMAGEYTYNNGESMSQIKLRSGVVRYFFFFGDHLWKIYDVYKLGKKSKLGVDFDAALEALTKQFGKAPRSRKADFSAGRNVDEDDWADKETIVRLFDHGGTAAGLAYVDRQIDEHLDRYRTNKAGKKELDSDVSDVTKPGKSEDKNKDVGAAYTSKHK
jgi:hypothetical protein